jgi:hypothetical protein
MSCALLADRHQLSESFVKRPPFRGRRVRGHRPSEQRVREPEPVAVGLQHPGVERVGQPQVSLAAHRGLDKGQGRLRERRHGTNDLARRAAETIEALLHELLQTRGKRKLLARDRASPPSLECASELEGKEGIAARRLPDPQEHRSGKGDVNTGSEQLVERTDAQRTQLQREQRPRRLSSAQPRPRCATGR